MSRVRALYGLQIVDSQIDAQLVLVSRAEAVLADTSSIDVPRQYLADVEAALSAIRSKQRDVEYESEKTAKHASDLENKLYGNQIKGVKEMAAAQQEIETFKQRHKELDDQTVEVMVLVEEAEASVKAAKAKLAEAEADKKKNDAASVEQKAQAAVELVKFRAQREQALKAVMPTDVSIYEKLRTQKQGVAVAEVLNGKLCGKCRVDQPTSKISIIKGGLQIVNCQSCGRILYWKLS